jgi:hypothetical protein
MEKPSAVSFPLVPFRPFPGDEGLFFQGFDLPTRTIRFIPEGADRPYLPTLHGGRLPHSKYAAPNPWMSRFAKPSVFRSDAECTSPVHRPFADIGSESSRIRFECPLLIPTKEPKSADPLPEVRSSLDVFRTYRCSRSFRRGLSPSTTCSEPTGLDCLAQPLPGRLGKLPLPLVDPLLLRTHSHFQAFESRRRHPAHRLSLRLP